MVDPQDKTAKDSTASSQVNRTNDVPVARSSNSATESEPAHKESSSSISETNFINDDAGSKSVKKERKSVKFAHEPLDDLVDRQETDYGDGQQIPQENIFGKIPPELSYLEKRSDNPKPLPQITGMAKVAKKSKKVLSLDDLPDLPSRAVKEISAVNKNTILNFNYHEVVLPVGPDRILVEVRYSSLFSPDVAKLRKYTYNISNERIGIGYDFVGEIVELGKNFAKSEKFKKGMKVFGVTNPLEKKGALQTCVIVNPSDIMLVLSDEEISAMEHVDITLHPKISSQFKVEESDTDDTELSLTQMGTENSGLNLPTLSKFCAFGSQYCRAKQAIALMDKVFKKQGSANILINGADTLLGKMIVQLIASSVYHEILSTYNVTLVVSEKNVPETKSLISQLNCGGFRNFNVVAFDMANEDLVLPGETIPINYKKVPFFATEVIDSILKIIPESEKISKQNTQKLKLDLFVDIIGSKKMFQKSVDMLKIDQVNFPFTSRLEEGVRPSNIFGKNKGPLFQKLMKPKTLGSSFVSFCNFELSEPSYSVDKMITFKGSAIDPWTSTWTRGIANMLVSGYNYYEISELQIKREWVEEAYALVKRGEIRVQIDEFSDWRADFRKRIERLSKRDGSILFQVESF
ncbi:hypothetical protein JCM33374_g5403 [Metschnikowia sp. JCM 33374]|nr:hypothetical protein JCM33374_g5403 [Metschnikowia sp. JCM 33374]